VFYVSEEIMKKAGNVGRDGSSWSGLPRHLQGQVHQDEEVPSPQ
jgi:hypothetical protein